MSRTVIAARYGRFGEILATIDSIEMSVPDDMTNRERRLIAEWEKKGNIIVLFAPTTPTVADVEVERDRRLALGFSYDFGDVRGIHQIATTPKDMIGWDEVTTFAQALINSGQSEQTIPIATATGFVAVTAAEWQSVLIAAAAFRQPIWGASFVLQAMNPIPTDFTRDYWWDQVG